MWTSMTGNKKVIFQLAGESSEDLQTLAGLMEAGDIKTVIDRRYPLEQTAGAHKYVETGAKKGNVIITIDQEKTGYGA